MTDYTKLIERLRKAGYDMHTDVYALLPEAVSAIDALQSKLGDAIRSLANWQHQFTEAQAENERLKQDRDEWRDSTIAANANAASEEKRRREMQDQRDQLQSQLDSMGKGAPDGNALLQAIARGWCSEKNSGKVMDALLALAIRDEVQKLYAAPKALAPLKDEPWMVKAIDEAYGIGGTP